ncbi:hypothetical protein L6452_43015 [Arctium lappa]|uniref:Uncharacterized protein n=1 Tax=Arctium lappa TaxID=4217 RepID=A0ACB8XKE7_ARCLA|nr:hypothetical protein L6452_43015 [Arctium lappa]
MVSTSGKTQTLIANIKKQNREGTGEAVETREEEGKKGERQWITWDNSFGLQIVALFAQYTSICSHEWRIEGDSKNATGWGSTFTEGCSCSNCCWNHGCISDLINEKYKWHQFLAWTKNK